MANKKEAVEKVRVMRVIVYEGPRELVERTLIGSIKGTRFAPDGLVIHAATIGEFPQILESKGEIRYACGNQNSEGHYKMWAGPYETEAECLLHNGENDKSVIIKFDEDRYDKVTKRWSSLVSKWIPATDQ